MIGIHGLTRSTKILTVLLAGAAVASCKDSGTGPGGQLSAVESITAGYHHTCAVDTDGVAYCWGNNEYGQLGEGSAEVRRTKPVAVVGDLRFNTVIAGGYHTCGITTTGPTYCWGKNEFGQLGNGTTDNSNQAVPVSGDHRFIALAAGESHTCGLLGSGQVYCWGLNLRGQLGNGTNIDSSVPTLVEGGHAFELLLAGYEHTCGLTAEGKAYCWGKNAHGQLGNGTRVHANLPVEVAGGLAFRALGASGGASAGQNHTCAITSAGAVYCWGDNWHNQTGTSLTRGAVVVPTQVPGIPEIKLISAGGDHTCGLTAEGLAWCWGDAKRGQLGSDAVDPDEEYSPPVEVSDGHAFANLTMGWDHSCGTTITGEAYCWGFNGNGQLGNGFRQVSNRPAAVLFD